MLLHFLSCAVHQPSRFGNTDAVVPKVLSMQVHQAWSAAAIAVGADGQGRGGEAVAAEELTPSFEHDGGHFLPASKQVIAANLSSTSNVCNLRYNFHGVVTRVQARDALALFIAKFR